MEKKLVIYASIVLLFLFFLAAFLLPQPYRRIAVDTTGFPTVGDHSAPVHVVLIEEFACVQCKRLHNEEMPLLRKQYIETGKVKLTTIPLAYLEASKTPFLSLHCANSQGTVHFHQFIDRFFSLPLDKFLNQSARDLFSLYGREYPEFSQATAINCVRETSIAPLLDKVEHIVAPIFKGQRIELPTILINGRRIQKMNWQTIQKHIEEELAIHQKHVEIGKAS